MSLFKAVLMDPNKPEYTVDKKFNIPVTRENPTSFNVSEQRLRDHAQLVLDGTGNKDACIKLYRQDWVLIDTLHPSGTDKDKGTVVPPHTPSGSEA